MAVAATAMQAQSLPRVFHGQDPHGITQRRCPSWAHAACPTRPAPWHQAGRQAAQGTKGGQAPDPTISPTPISTGTGTQAFSQLNQTAATAYTVLAGTSAILAGAAVSAPDLLLSFLLPGYNTALDPTFLRIAGCTLLVSAAAEWSLQDAAANNRLASGTYQRLLLGSCLKSSGFLLAFALAQPAWTPQLWVFYPIAATTSLLVGITTLVGITSKDGAKLGCPLVPQNAVSSGYAVIFLLYLLTAAACYAPPSAPGGLFVGDVSAASTQLLQHTWAPGFLLAACAALNLKDAADRGRLSAGTFKRLNLGLAGLELSYAAVFGGALMSGQAVADGACITNLAGSLAIATFCSYQWAYAVQK